MVLYSCDNNYIIYFMFFVICTTFITINMHSQYVKIIIMTGENIQKECPERTWSLKGSILKNQNKNNIIIFVVYLNTIYS